MSNRQEQSRTYEASELGHDPYDGYYIDGACPNCGQDYARVFLGSLCVECSTVFDIAEVEVAWTDE